MAAWRPREAPWESPRGGGEGREPRHVGTPPFPPRRGAGWELRGGGARRDGGGHFVSASLASVERLVWALRLGREELGCLLSV